LIINTVKLRLNRRHYKNGILKNRVKNADFKVKNAEGLNKKN